VLQSFSVKYDNQIMTLWSPTLPENDTPIYRRIADQLERDVATGLLLPGSRLPTHRELAARLGITVVTVTRAYAEGAHRGLIDSTVGRGSFVRTTSRGATTVSEIDLSTNIVTGDFGMTETLAQRIAAVLATSYGIGNGSERHRSAGAKWMSTARPDATAAHVVVTAGAQQAILLALAAVTRPGDVVLAEELTYHGAKAAADMLHVTLAPLPVDRWGLLPDALATALRKRNAPRVLYTLPTLQNPTGSMMPDKRRREIAAIAEKHGLTIIEDDVYGFLAEDAPSAITSHVPDRGIFITGVGKCLSPSLRVGYMLAPERLLPAIQQLLAASTLFASPIGAEIAASAIEEGAAARAITQKRESIAMRRRIADRVLGRRASHADAHSPHLWLILPSHWGADAITEEARQRNVRIAAASSFAVGTEIPSAIRICLGAPATAAEVETGLQVVASLLERGASAAATVV
jgi:DNA-binding transcriptional MocR family regulator